MTPEFLAARRELAWKSAGAATWAGAPLVVVGMIQPLVSKPIPHFLEILVGFVLIGSLMAGLSVSAKKEPFVKVEEFNNNLVFSLFGPVGSLPFIYRLCQSVYIVLGMFIAYAIFTLGGHTLLRRAQRQLPADSPLRLPPEDSTVLSESVDNCVKAHEVTA
ncbi:MAG: hypothetical protein BGO01_00430 [Armatimonadetes bacterium 55-13]|nr:hypothetical protein [Armatimonadota bacterium]ODU52372.1 MAG: hypothetical protein ABT09_02735 [bacterium SCN 57-13]OJU63165.1 MAG: hypothetical protein BGO01_00430 [Armatimonadetes bacterium 55-13]